jgi:outer membrane protein assembly factor BamB
MKEIAMKAALVGGLLLTLMAPFSLRAEPSALEILKASGVQGGLVVHVGCGDGRFTATLHANNSFLVHGLDADPKQVAAARRHIESLGLYGVVSVEQWTAKSLPYAENLVNLVVSENLGGIPVAEVMRVLAPGGVAYIKQSDGWAKTSKPWPKEIDQWTHYLHDASNNAVAHDSLVGPPRHLQWLGSPRWSRHHDHLASTDALVSAGGRIFYIFDEGQTATLATPSKWTLLARDAFNGTMLWKRPLKDWQTEFWPLKSGPAQLPRRLVADEGMVFATLGINVPLTALDAATGKTVRTYEGTKGTVEVLFSNGVLFLLVDPALNTEKYTNARTAKEPWWHGEKVKILAVRAASGEVLWQHEAAVLPLCLAVDDQRVLFHDGERVVCLDRAKGNEKWKSEPIPRVKNILSFFAPTLVVQQGVVLFAGGEESGLAKSGPGATKSDKLTALDAQTGGTLWTGEHPPSGYSSPEDVFVLGNSVWCEGVSNGNLPGVTIGRDVRTGKVTSSFPADVDAYWFHHRCYRGKATDKYLMVSRTGIEFIDVAAKHWTTNHWIRGGCLYGIMPANGLIYAPPHDCICYPESKQFGFNAVAAASPSRAVPKNVPDEGWLEKGPAFAATVSQAFGSTRATGGVSNPQSLIPNPSDWPTYRHDAERSGVTACSVPAALKTHWTTDLGGRLSSIVVSEGRLYLAAIDQHSVRALDASTGKPLWKFTAGGRVDSPPTLYQHLVLFGSADGYVYCLRASDGVLVWRFRAAPLDRRITAFEQIESLWPVSGSVLVADGIVHCVAGRSMFLDGGLRYLKLEARSGRKLLEKVLDDRVPDGNEDLQNYVKWLNMPVALPDVLSTDGRYVYMRSQPLDAEGNRPRLGPVSSDRFQVVADQSADRHLFSPTGFLDDSWYHRSYWIYGRSFSGGWNGYYLAGKVVPAGQLLVVDNKTVFGYGRKPEYYRWTTPIEYRLFAADKDATAVKIDKEPDPTNSGTDDQPSAGGKAGKKKGAGKGKKAELGYLVKHPWTEDIPFFVRGMVLSGKQSAQSGAAGTLFVAGPPMVARRTAEPNGEDADQDAALEGRKGGLLWAVSAADGKRLAEYHLDAPPVWDGMIAAEGRLFLATMSGQVVCLGEK